jgi:anti-sigma B factor antagonist
MEIATKKENNALTVTVSGRLDTVTAPDLEKTLTEQLAGVTALEFDLKDLTYTSSAGLRVFLKAQKQMNRQGTMKLTGVSEPILEILEMTGFTEMMTIEAKA